jgi:exodeoxyribonuclease V alpha subunit
MSAADLQNLSLLGHLELLDVELARSLVRSASNPTVGLAVALTCRNVRNGHACFPIDIDAEALFTGEAGAGLELPDPSSWTEALTCSGLTTNGPLVLDSGKLYLRRYWELERDIAKELAARAAPFEHASSEALARRLTRLFPDGPDSPQAAAAKRARMHRVSLLCGGPGTGKTTTVAAVVALLVEEATARGEPPPKTLLLAPTGKAAARLGEAVRAAKARIDASGAVLDAIPTDASTVQRALGMRPDGLRFSRNRDRPLEADVIVVDEASMIDLGLMRQLLDATPPDARLIIVGDPDQLTSVEAGSVLRDLVTAGEETWWKDRVTTLRKTHRYDATQPLGRLIASVREGDGAEVRDLLSSNQSDDVRWAPFDALGEELDGAARRWARATSADEPGEHFARRAEYAVLTPFRKGRTGTRRLALLIEERLAAAASTVAASPILIEENSRELGVFNGDLAFVRPGATPTAVIPTEDAAPRTIAEARLPRYSSAYALSIHKSQGSEFDEVLIVLPEEDAPLMTREVIYTAVSRARRRVRIVGHPDVLLAAVARQARRDSGLVGQVGRLG